jgi:peptidylprolyl isomerase
VSDHVRATLSQLVSERGIAILENPSVVRAYLADLCPSEQSQRFVLFAALNFGIPLQLRSHQPTSGIHLIDRVAQQFRAETGVGERECRWAVESIALAMGLIDPHALEIQAPTTKAKPASNGAQNRVAVKPKPPTHTPSRVKQPSAITSNTPLQSGAPPPISANSNTSVSVNNPRSARIGVRISILIAITLIVILGLSLLGRTPNNLSTPTSNPGTASTAAHARPHPIAHKSPAGTFGKRPTISVPPGKPPHVLESADLIRGSGLVARTGDTLTVDEWLGTYSARRIIYWSLRPFTFVLNQANVGRAWAEGLQGMRVGGRRELIVPPVYGPGIMGYTSALSRTDTMIFIIDLHRVVAP